jgi:hypothetical protein
MMISQFVILPVLPDSYRDHGMSEGLPEEVRQGSPGGERLKGVIINTG